MADEVVTLPGTGEGVAVDKVAGVDYQLVKLVDATEDSIVRTGVSGHGLTVDNSGTFAVQADTELTTADLDTGAGTDTRAVVGLVGSKSGGGVLIPGDATKGLAVDLTATGANATAIKVDGSAVTQPVSDGGGSLTVDSSDLSGAATSLAIIDDWDESDRAKVNPIAGQVGVQGGSGAVSATTQRTVLATDVALPAGTNAIGKLAANSGVDIGDVDVTSVPADPFGVNADAASATGSISAKLRFIANTGIPVTGTVTVDSELAAAAALADAASNPTTATVGAGNLMWNGVTWDRQRGTTLDGLHTTQRYTIWADSLADGISAGWTQTTANGGTIASTVGEGQLKTSTATNGSAQIVGPTLAYYPGSYGWMNSAVRFGDTGTAGDIRRLGMYTVSGTTPQEGFYYELSGTTLNAVVVKAGSATAVASGSWSQFAVAPFTLDTNYHSFEIRYTANTVRFYVDNVLRHEVSGTTSALTTSLSLPIAATNVKTSGASDITLAIRNIGAGSFGVPGGTQVEDAAHFDGDRGIFALSLRRSEANSLTSSAGSDNDYAALNTDARGLLQVVARPYVSRIRVASGGLTTTSPAYTIGDQAGTIMTFAGCARVSGGTGTILSAVLLDKGDVGSDYRLHIYRSSVTLSGGDNGAWAVSDADQQELIGILTMPSMLDVGANRVSTLANIGLPYDCAATSLFVGIETRTANAVYAAATDLNLILTVCLD